MLFLKHLHDTPKCIATASHSLGRARTHSLTHNWGLLLEWHIEGLAVEQDFNRQPFGLDSYCYWTTRSNYHGSEPRKKKRGRNLLASETISSFLLNSSEISFTQTTLVWQLTLHYCIGDVHSDIRLYNITSAILVSDVWTWVLSKPSSHRHHFVCPPQEAFCN